MTMSRKDYIEFAAMFRNMKPSDLDTEQGHIWACLVDDTALIFTRDNPNFDYDRFVSACDKD